MRRPSWPRRRFLKVCIHPLTPAMLRCFVSRSSRPSPRQNNILPQVWDDGHPRSVRFRAAHWERFDAPPGLISRASFFRNESHDVAGRGNVHKDATPNLAHGSLEAAYEVQSTTNLNGLVLPVSFSLTRYNFPKSPSDRRRIVTTDSVVAFEVRTNKPAEPLSVSVPVRTVVNDFRAAPSIGTPLVYVIESGQIPGTAEVKQSKLYQRARQRLPWRDSTQGNCRRSSLPPATRMARFAASWSFNSGATKVALK